MKRGRGLPHQAILGFQALASALCTTWLAAAGITNKSLRALMTACCMRPLDLFNRGLESVEQSGNMTCSTDAAHTISPGAPGCNIRFVNGVELYLLGQRLMRIGGNALLEDSGLRQLSPSAWLIMADVVRYRDTPVPEIASRTGLPHDYVSASVSRMADDGLLETGVAPSGQESVAVHHALRLEEEPASADWALALALDAQDAGQVGELTATLESLAQRLSAATSPHRGKNYDATYGRGGGTPSWDIGRPQPAFEELAKAGAIRGRVLDVGCGTGEHALMATGLGLPALGVDVSSAAIELARRKAGARKLPARFAVHDALDLGALAEQFDTVLDSCLFHNLSDEDRARYADGLREVIPPGGRYFMLCLSDRESPGPMPQRVTQEEIKSTFADGWRVDEIEPVTLELTIRPNGAPGWLAAVTRT